MKYAIIAGSHRSESQSSKVGGYVKGVLEGKGEEVYLLNLKDNPIPLWHEDAWDSDSDLAKLWAPYGKEIESSDAYVIISPEWSGMASPGVKNFFVYAGSALAHKPSLLVAVSGSRGGAYPIAELRMSSYKNTHICHIPDHVIVRDVEKVLNDDKLDEGNKADFFIKGKIANSLGVLAEYAKALRGVRESGAVDLEKYPYGM